VIKWVAVQVNLAPTYPSGEVMVKVSVRVRIRAKVRGRVKGLPWVSE